MTVQDVGTTTRVEMTYATAVREALRRCLSSLPETLFYGEDVAEPGGVFGVSKGLQAEFGDRVFDTPISESAILGSAVGAAMLGRRPIVEIMWIDFSLVALDQIVNQLANVHYVSRGDLRVAVTIRTQQGNAPGACAQHSQNLEALFLHVPGLRVCMPSTPQDAYDLLVASVHADDPVLFIENRTLYHGDKQPVDVDGPVQDIGGLRVRREGTDATVVTWGAMTHRVLAAAEALSDEAISVEVLETPWLNPWPTDLVIERVTRTGRIAVVHEANVTAGFGAEVIARLHEAGVQLDAPAVRVGMPDSRIPSAPSLARGLVPSVERITERVRELVLDSRYAAPTVRVSN